MLRIVFVAVLALVAIAAPANAGGRKPAAKPKATPVKILVTNVSATAVTITDDKGSKTLNVTPFTEIIVNGQKATLTDVKPGMVVEVALRDPTTASRINAAASN
jgi:hypothetical protein